MLEIAGFVLLGLLTGIISGLMGIGGAVVMIPALVYLFNFDQRMAQGTTLVLMVPPIGLLAALEYYREGFVDWKAGMIIALFFFLGGLIGGRIAMRFDALTLRRIFGAFLFLISIRMILK